MAACMKTNLKAVELKFISTWPESRRLSIQNLQACKLYYNCGRDDGEVTYDTRDLRFESQDQLIDLFFCRKNLPLAITRWF